MGPRTSAPGAGLPGYIFSPRQTTKKNPKKLLDVLPTPSQHLEAW